MRRLIRIALAASAFIACGRTIAAEPPRERPRAPDRVVYDSPQAVFEAARQAARAQDWRKEFACHTPEGQADRIFEAHFACGMHETDPNVVAILKKHHVEQSDFDAESERRLREVRKTAGDANASAEPPDNRKFAVEVTNAITADKPGFYADVCKQFANRDEPGDVGPLQDVVISGSTATGRAAMPVYSRSREPGKPEQKKVDMIMSTYHFKKTKSGWLMEP